ncbi:extracellular solute-binding protein [Cellulomonas sp. ACRRI]|uniref:extracellular solute-binding protein n=1 Tax=Cellulomonas sp. ACRRI TaxID=2918188 RepID=UPI001EF3099E|nr:extracellular solute-binding protein [Cellulomonas sp. ACRRI]MCG7285785.1 extracellular solute-binding protein [Cellulomonas sp. ACRRI]
MRSRTAAVALAATITLAATAACAPAQSGGSAAADDVQDGTLRVWLFSEVTQDPKEQVVDEAVAEFEADHEGVEVEVEYIPVDARSERFTGAFNDPSSAPDVAEIGNTDLAGFVDAGGLMDVTDAIADWDEGADIDPAVLATTEIDGASYAVPWYIGVRALYYRTDVFDELGLQPPASLAELEETARTVRAARPELVGIATGGAAQFAFLPYIWAHGGEIARQDADGAWTGTLDSAEAREGVAAYARLLGDDICPAQTCAEWGGNASVQEFVAGNAAMTIGGDFNRRAVDESAVGDRYAVVPLPGVEEGSIAPAFGGGNHLAVLSSTERRTLATEFVQLLAGKRYQQAMFDAMGNIPVFTDVQADVAEQVPAIAPFVETLAAGTAFVPVTPAWSTVDAQGVLPTMVQTVATGAADVEMATADATAALDAAFGAQ